MLMGHRKVNSFFPAACTQPSHFYISQSTYQRHCALGLHYKLQVMHSGGCFFCAPLFNHFVSFVFKDIFWLEKGIRAQTPPWAKLRLADCFCEMPCPFMNRHMSRRHMNNLIFWIKAEIKAKYRIAADDVTMTSMTHVVYRQISFFKWEGHRYAKTWFGQVHFHLSRRGGSKQLLFSKLIFYGLPSRNVVWHKGMNLLRKLEKNELSTH